MKAVSTLLAVLLSAPLAVGCATAASASSCRPGEATVSCCIKKFPLSPVESCGITEAEAMRTLVVLAAAYEATEFTEDEDEFANNAGLPEWKQKCIKLYVDCKNQHWTGNCYDCIRRCEGQHDWPFAICEPRKRRRR
jgi:hypothetical protein